MGALFLSGEALTAEDAENAEEAGEAEGAEQKMLNGNVRRCKHIKTNGIQCGSPAVRESDYCYFHRQAARDFPKRKAVKQEAAEPVIDLAVIDDADGIHYAILQVIRGIANGTLTDKASGKILYALQVLSANYKQTSFYQQAQDEYKASNLNAYQMWDRMKLEDNDRKRKELFEQRKAELEKLERTCSKCGHECGNDEELSPKVPPMKEQWPEDPDIDDYAPQVTIKASQENRAIGRTGHLAIGNRKALTAEGAEYAEEADRESVDAEEAGEAEENRVIAWSGDRDRAIGRSSHLAIENRRTSFNAKDAKGAKEAGTKHYNGRKASTAEGAENAEEANRESVDAEEAGEAEKIG